MSNPDLEAVLQPRGSQKAVAVALGVSKQTVNDWKRQGFVSPHHAAGFEEFTGLPREKACPCFNWGKPMRRAKQKAEA